MANSSDDRSEARSKEQDDTRESAPPEVNESADRARSERSSSPPETEAGEEGRSARHTERPVAHSVKPPPSSAPSTKRGFVWVAVLALFGVAGYTLRNPEAPRASAARPPSETPPGAFEPSSPHSEPSPSLGDTSAVSDPAVTPLVEVAQPEPVAPSMPRAKATLAANAPRARDTESPRAAALNVAARTLAPPAADTAAIAPSAVAPAKPAPFSLKAANSSLDRSARAASTCRRGTDPSGVARAVVSFAPTGRVTAAVISGPPFAGTETGSCIARTLRQTVIPEFEGPITTVAKTVEVQ